jgi:outer membrane biogenesis lipoprotein LolB
VINTLYNEASSTLQWLRIAPKSYKLWLAELLATELKQLKSADNLVHVHRAQGRVEILDRLIGLDEELLKATKKEK